MEVLLHNKTTPHIFVYRYILESSFEKYLLSSPDYESEDDRATIQQIKRENYRTVDTGNVVNASWSWTTRRLQWKSTPPRVLPSFKLTSTLVLRIS